MSIGKYKSLPDGGVMTIQEIADELHLSRTYVQVIYKRALRKLYDQVSIDMLENAQLLEEMRTQRGL